MSVFLSNCYKSSCLTSKKMVTLTIERVFLVVDYTVGLKATLKKQFKT